MKSGVGMMKWASGEIYEGEWRDDFMEGFGQFTNAMGESKRLKFRRGIVDFN